MQNISIKLVLENAQFLAQATKSSAAIQTFGVSTKQSSAFLSHFAAYFTGGALLGGVSALGSILKTVAKTSIATAASYELQKKKFANLLGDVKKGTRLFEELKQFAATTPLRLDDITSGTEKLLAFGVANEDVIDTMRRLGDISLGQADKLSSLTNAYGKLKAKGKATLEELNLFTENGVPLMDALADTLGVSTQEVFKLVSAGKVGFSDVDRAIRSLTDEGGKFAGLMDDASTTLTGKWSTFNDVMTQVGAELATGTIPLLKSAVDWVTNIGSAFLESNKVDAILSEDALPTENDVDALRKRMQSIKQEVERFKDELVFSGYYTNEDGIVDEQAIEKIAQTTSLYTDLVAVQTKYNQAVDAARGKARNEGYQASQQGAKQLEETINALTLATNNYYATTDKGKLEAQLDALNKEKSLAQELIDLKHEGKDVDTEAYNKAIANRTLLNQRIEGTQKALQEVGAVQTQEAGTQVSSTYLTTQRKAREQVIVEWSNMHATEIQLLQEKAQKFRESGIEEVEVAQWVAEQTKQELYTLKPLINN